MRIVAFVSVLLILLVSFIAEPFVKTSHGSHHYGITSAFEFNEENKGVGRGIRLGGISISEMWYTDSYNCTEAYNLQIRFTTEISEHVRSGWAWNIAYKCLPRSNYVLFIAPTMVYEYIAPFDSSRCVHDIIPRIPRVNPVGILARSCEYSS